MCCAVHSAPAATRAGSAARASSTPRAACTAGARAAGPARAAHSLDANAEGCPGDHVEELCVALGAGAAICVIAAEAPAHADAVRAGFAERAVGIVAKCADVLIVRRLE